MSKIQTEIDSCVKWAIENGSSIPENYGFKYTNESGVQCFSKSAITKDTEPLEISESIILTNELAATALKSYITSSDLPSNSLLKVLIIVLKKYSDKITLDFGSGKSNSFYEPYMNVLPDTIFSPLLWNESELELLKGSDLVLKRNSILENEIAPEFNTVVSKIQLPAVKITLQDYIWAHLVITSRGFPSILLHSKNKQEAFLWPIVDFLNHKSDSKVTWDYESSLLKFKTDQEKEIEQGQEVFNNYGDNKTSDDLVLNYGFLSDEIVKDDHTMVTLRVPSAELVTECEKVHYIKFDEVIPQADGCVVKFKVYGQFNLPINLIKFFSYLCKLSKENFLSVRSTLEGLDQLLKIMDAKLKFYKQKLHSTKNCREQIIGLVKKYKNVMRQIFQSNIDLIQQFEKNLITTNMKKNMKSFKTCIKEDSLFQNSLLLVFGSFDYNKLKEVDLLQQILLLYIVKVSKSEHSEDFTNNLIKECFTKTKEEITIDAEDLKEYTPLYNTFFPSLKNRIPEVYGSDWTLEDFVVAGTVVDNICWTRPINQEIFFIEQKPYSLM